MNMKKSNSILFILIHKILTQEARMLKATYIQFNNYHNYNHKKKKQKL